MRRRINVMLAVGVLVGLVVFSVGVHFLHAYQIESSAGDLPGRAETFEKEGKYKDAEKALTRYTTHRPDDREGWERLCDFLIRRIEGPSATDLGPGEAREFFMNALIRLETMVGRFEDATHYRRKLAQYLRYANRTVDAQQHYQKVLEHDPNDAESAVQYAMCLYESTDATQRQLAVKRLSELVGYDDARETFDKSKAKAKDNIQAYLSLAHILRRDENKPAIADAAIEAMIDANPSDFRVFHARAMQRLEAKKLDEAQQDIERALALDKEQKNSGLMLQAARIARAQNDEKRAQEVMDQALAKFPKDVNVYAALVDISWAANQRGKAMEYVGRGLDVDKDNPILLQQKAMLQATEGDAAAAKETLKVLKTKMRERDPKYELLTAQVALREGRHAEAMRTLERIRTSFSDAGELSRIDRALAETYEELNQFDRQLEALQRIEKVSKDDIGVMIAVARAQDKLGRSEEALRIYARLKDDEKLMGEERFCKTPQVWASYFELTLRRQLRKAERDRDWTPVENLLAALEKYKALTPQGIAKRRIDVLDRQGRLEEMRTAIDALMVLERAKTDPKEADAEVWLMDVRLLAREEGKGPEAALKALDEAEKKFGDSVFMRLQRAQLLVMKGGEDVDRDLAALEQNTDSLNREQLWRGLVPSYANRRNYDEIKRLTRQVMAEDPNDLNIRMQLFDWCLISNDDEGMTHALAEIEKLMGKDSSILNYCSAARLVNKARREEDNNALLEQARAHLKRAAERRPNWHMPPRLEAEICGMQNDRPGVIENLNKALNLGPADASTVSTLAKRYLEKGAYDDARKAIDRLGDARMPKELRQLDAELEFVVASAAGDTKFPKSEKLTADLLVDMEKEGQLGAAEHVWHALMLSRFGKMDEAEQAIRKAVEIEPTNVTYWMSLISHLASQKKMAEAKDAIRRFSLSLPEDMLAAHLPKCYAMVGNFQDAERLYRELVDSQPDNVAYLRELAMFYVNVRQLNKAEDYVDRILAIERPRFDPNMVWARSQKARLLASTTDFPDFEEAMKLLEVNYVNGKPPLVTLQLEIELLSSRREFGFWEEAIKKLLALRERRPLPSEFQMMLAKLYHQTNDWEKCRQELYNLDRMEGQDPRVQAMIVDTFLAHNEPRNAETYQDNLEKLQPKSPETKRRRALLLAAQGNKAEAAKTLLAIVPPPKAEESEQDLAMVLYVANEFFNRLKDMPRAEALFRRYVKARPDQEYLLAQVLLSQGQPKQLEEAITIGERLYFQVQQGKSALPPDAVMDLGSRAYRYAAKNLTKSQIDRIEKWHMGFKRENEGSVSVLTRIAELRDLQGREKEAVDSYREILKQTDLEDNVRGFVLNNAAFLAATGGGGDIDEALAWAEEALKLLGPRSDVLDTRGIVYHYKGDKAKALADLRAAVKGGATAVKYFHLAVVENEAGNAASAAEAWGKMVQLGIDVPTLSPAEQKMYERLKAAIKPQETASR